MQIHHKPTKIAVTGSSGSGKTTYVLRYLRNSSYDFIFIYDHKLEFLERENYIVEFDRTKLVERVINNEKVISYNYLEDYPGDSQSGFEFFCEWTYEISKQLNKRVLYVCDEFNRFTDSHSTGWEFRQLIEDGRLQGLDFIGTSHSGNQVNNLIRNQLTELVAFNTQDSTPLAFLEDNGFPIDEVRSLCKPGEFITKDCVNDKFVRGKLFSLTSRPESDTSPDNGELTPQEPSNEINSHGGGNIGDSGGSGDELHAEHI